MDKAIKTAAIVSNFMEAIWNKNLFDKIDDYLHEDFIDHSLPPNLPGNKEGLILWITATGKSFEYRSIIEEQVTENEKSIIKFRLTLKHIGVWRDIEPTGFTISVIGYRYFRAAKNKIIEHWALIDGNSIENQLREAGHGCKIQN